MTKIENSIELIKKHEPPEGYHLAFSGGKDSICILKLAKMAGVKFTAYFYMTTLDPPEVLSFIRKFYPEVNILRPKISMFKLIEKKGLPIRQKRFCCQYLKEIHGHGEIVMQGIRKDESVKRSKRKEFEIDRKDKTKRFLNPIFSWSKNDVWNFIYSNKLPFPEIYLSCKNRIGCVACPMNPTAAAADLENYPRYKKAFLKAIRKRMDAGGMKIFESPEEAIEWWVSGLSVKSFRESKKQIKMDFTTQK
jgi:phosphoadenosine phosphosulfate reductase